MKKVFLCLIAVCLFISYSLIFVKAEEITTTVTLRNEVSVRTDANVGIKWEASVSNPQEGQIYGFVFAQGKYSGNDLVAETPGAVTKEVEELKEDGKYHATMVKFPKAAAVQDISVRAYYRVEDNYVYSDYIDVRNLAETIIKAKNSSIEGEGIEAVYNYVKANTKKVYNVGDYLYVLEPLYEYEPTELAKVFIEDWNRIMGDSITTLKDWAGQNKNGSAATVSGSVITETNIYKFYHANENEMMQKWGWLLTYIESVADNQYVTKQVNYIKGTQEIKESGNADWYGSQHLISRIENFFTRKSATTGLSYQSSAFTTSGEYKNLINILTELDVKFNSTIECDYVNIGSNATMLDQPELATGYAWDGYKFNENLYPASGSYPVTSENAVFVPTSHLIQYSITYMDGEEEITTLEPKEYNIKSSTFTLPSYSKDGYKFEGWYLDKEFTSEVVTEIKSGSHENITLYAKTSVQEYYDVTVTFNLNGGGAMRYESVDEAAEDLVKDLSAFKGTTYTRQSYTITQWGIKNIYKFFIDETYRDKWAWLVEYWTLNAGDNPSSKDDVAPFVHLYNVISSKADTPDATLHGWNSSWDPYAIDYEVCAFVNGNKNSVHSGCITADYSSETILSKVLPYAQGNTVLTYNEPAELPTPTRKGYEFQGWYENQECTGEKVISYPGYRVDINSITYYAKWNKLSSVVELSEADLEALEAVLPTIVVNSNFIDDTYTVNGTLYTYGDKAFSKISDALAIATEGDKIYVFKGSYADELTITASNVLVYGPNYNVHGNTTRSDEAIITNLTNINASGVTINGLKFTSAGNIKVGANNVTITNIYMKPDTTVAAYEVNRQGCIVGSVNISGLIVSNSYIAAPGTSNSYAYQFMSFNYVTNLTIKNNYICNPKQSTISSSYAGMRIYNMNGVFEFSSNTIAWGTDGYVFNLANASGTSAVNVIDNIFKDNGLITQTATLAIQSCPTTCQINVIGNEFYSFKGSTLTLNNDKGSAVSIKYNYYDENTNFKLTTKGSAVVTYENNCYMNTLNKDTVVTDYGIITSKAALDAAYAEYKAALK